MPLISRNRSIIPACDVPLPRLRELVSATAPIDEIGAYKVGAALALSVGLPAVVGAIREVSDKPIIYDHQKAGTDIPETAEFFMSVLREAGVNAVIIFPQAGPSTQAAWTAAARNQGLDLIVGAMMTHPRYLASDGGFLRDDAPMEIYREAAARGVNSFVVPGTQAATIKQVRQLVNKAGHQPPAFYAPGFVVQGGKLNEALRAAGPVLHAIIGRAIYDAADIRGTALELARSLR